MSNTKTTAEQSIRRVIQKRLARGATPESIRSWLEHCRDEVWRSGATHEAIKKLLRNLPELTEERAALDALVAIELDAFAAGVAQAAKDDELDNFRMSCVSRIRTILGA